MTGEQVTVRAVLAEARRLRERAARERLLDPYAKPYELSDKAARNLSAQLGPAAAIQLLRLRAAVAQAKYREDQERAERARRRLERRQKVTDAEHRHRLSGLSLGQRLDEALGSLVTVSEVAAAGMGEPVTHGKPDAVAPRPSENRAGSLRERALLLVCEIEDEVPRSRRRLGARREGRAA